MRKWSIKAFMPASSPAHAFNPSSASRYFSIGAPYIALAADWIPIASNWTSLMAPALERNHGNLAEMYAFSLAVAHVTVHSGPPRPCPRASAHSSGV